MTSDGAARYDACLGDVVVAESVSKGDRKLRPALSHWRSDARHPRPTGDAVLRVMAAVDRNDVRVKARVLPLRCKLDAEFLRFLDAHGFPAPVVVSFFISLQKKERRFLSFFRERRSSFS